jgi:hypothetical protein
MPAETVDVGGDSHLRRLTLGNQDRVYEFVQLAGGVAFQGAEEGPIEVLSVVERLQRTVITE